MYNRIKAPSLYLLILLIFSASLVQAAPNSFAPIVQSEKEKVIHISTSSVVENPTNKNPLFQNHPGKQRRSALGSGFIVSSDGYIVTNHHVVAKADKIEVTLNNGKTYKSKIVGKDKLSDLALLKIDVKNLTFIKWGDSSKISVGDWVLAIGNPLGFDFTVTAGILSGRGRNVFGDTAYGQFLQTDAAINFGNSGGPLFNTNGEVIGINTAIVAGGQNLGFAIPSLLAQNIIEQLKKDGYVKRGWLGVYIQDVDQELAESFGLPEGMRGVAITEVGKDSPANKAGLEKGDVLINFNGKSLLKSNQLQQFVGETPPNSSISLKVFRKGNFIKKTVILELRPSDEIASLDSTINKYGLMLNKITPGARSALNLKEDFGLVVVNIDQTGLSWEKGLRKGDVILTANSQELRTLGEFSKILETASKIAKPVNLFINRNGRAFFMAL